MRFPLGICIVHHRESVCGSVTRHFVIVEQKPPAIVRTMSCVARDGNASGQRCTAGGCCGWEREGVQARPSSMHGTTCTQHIQNTHCSLIKIRHFFSTHSGVQVAATSNEPPEKIRWRFLQKCLATREPSISDTLDLLLVESSEGAIDLCASCVRKSGVWRNAKQEWTIEGDLARGWKPQIRWLWLCQPAHMLLQILPRPSLLG